MKLPLLQRLLAKLYGSKVRMEGSESFSRESADEMVREARRMEMILKCSGTMHGSDTFVSVFSKRGQKGLNQDCSIVWEGFGCQGDMMMCGVFDGHGPWGHYVAKWVRDSLPTSLLCSWQEVLACGIDHLEKKLCLYDVWERAFLRACGIVDKELENHRGMDAYNSGTTALTIVKQGEMLVIANVGDSRAVLATTSEDGDLVAVQLTVDCKPDLPQEAERIVQCKGRIFCLQDEPGVHRVWLPNGKKPGLAMSRAFGDYCVKDFGLISAPEVTQRSITNKDQFVILATDGIWDVMSNQEAVEIVSSSTDRGKSAKRLVEFAVRAWKLKRRGIAVDDCSAVCLFLQS